MCSKKRFWKNLTLSAFLGKFIEIFYPFPHFQATFLCVQNYLPPGKLSNLSFRAGAEQLICRTPPLAASVARHALHSIMLLYSYRARSASVGYIRIDL